MARDGIDPAALYEYLAKARAPVLERTRALAREQYTREFPFGLKTLRKTLVEIPNAEWSCISTTTGGLATQLVLHEVHHRAQAMAMRRQLGAPVEDLDFSTLTFDWEVLPAPVTR